MGVTEASRERMATALAALCERHGVARVVDDCWTVEATTYDRDRERHDAGTVGGAGAWVRDAEGRVLLVREEEEGGPWSEPGGKQEPGETLAQAAGREVREETGVTCSLGNVALAQRIAVTDGERGPLWRLVVVFDARRVGGPVSPRDGEIAAARWFEHRPQRLRYDALADLPFE